jgi:mRNA-degrading endonuclease RelE of RelBE toxin-antitoxin system
LAALIRDRLIALRLPPGRNAQIKAPRRRWWHEGRRWKRFATLFLRGLRRPQYRLRVGDVRVFYDVSGTIVEVLAIVAKSEAESWRAQFANPE